MSSTGILSDSLSRLISYIRDKNYRGYDPYDALRSPLFRLPVLRSNKKVRFYSQQVIKRCPVNLRPAFGIREGYDPVTLGLCIQGYSYIYHICKLIPQDIREKRGSQFIRTEEPLPYTSEEYLSRIEFLIDELKRLIPTGYHGACWGYDFDWEARYATIPALQPTVVATGIIANALYICHKLTGNGDCAELVRSAAGFVLHDLKRTDYEKEFIFSYSPFDNQQVLNASMKGVRILSQAYDLTGREEFRNEAGRAVRLVAHSQNEDGSWPYSFASTGKWTDSYHSGYVLDCLHEYSVLCRDQSFKGNLDSGFEFFRNHFIREDGMPCFYHNKPYPADCTAAAQTMLTLSRFGDPETAFKVASWMIGNMQSKNGYFYFRKYKGFVNKTSFMRWSQAWMFSALSGLLYYTGRNS